MAEAAEFLTSADASRVLDVTPATVRLMAKAGRLAVASVTPGGIRLFKRSEVERLRRERAKARR